ncbi:MAG: polymer-forming cytoskeletal protein [Solirubrobacterales bacterium]
MLRRLSSILVLLAAVALAMPAAAPASRMMGHGPGTAGHAGDAIVVVAGDVVVRRGETVESVFVVSGDVTVAGRVDGPVTVLSGDVTVAGAVDGDLFLASGRARLLPSARVTGDVRYGDEEPTIAPGALVGGVVEEEDWPRLTTVAWVAGIVVWLTLSVSAALLGLLLILIAPRAADAVAARSRERVGPTIAIGIAIAIVLPLVVGLAAITVLGLPLAIALGLALLPLAAVAYVASAWALGRLILGPPRNRYLAFLTGISILSVVGLVPIAGVLAWIAAVVFGLGLLGAAIGAAREEPRGEPTGAA